MKTCSKCENEKELSEFNRRGEGYKPKCRCCNSIDYKGYNKNNEKRKSNQRAYYYKKKEQDFKEIMNGR